LRPAANRPPSRLRHVGETRIAAWRRGLIAVVLVSSPVLLAGQSLTVLAMEGALHVRIPQLGLIEGPVSERLQDGRSVRIDFELTVLEKAKGSSIAKAQHSFNLSFDLWEQRFAVTRIGNSPRSISHLTARAAESWCLDNVTVPLTALGRFARDTPFWVRVDYRVQTRTPSSNPDESTFTLRTLIDALSRRRDDQEQAKSVEAGPFRLTN
jgi:hypothetical protein